jgi:hypothetical protein
VPAEQGVVHAQVADCFAQHHDVMLDMTALTVDSRVRSTLCHQADCFAQHHDEILDMTALTVDFRVHPTLCHQVWRCHSLATN